MYSLLSSEAFFLPITYLIAVKKDYGLKNLEIIITLGMLRGSSLKRFNCSTLYARLSNQDANPLLEG
jgi:hypothetical protein